MATLEDLNTSILLLSREEQIALIIKTRLSRRTPKFSAKTTKTETKTGNKISLPKTRKKKLSLKERLRLMTPAEREKLAKELNLL